MACFDWKKSWKSIKIPFLFAIFLFLALGFSLRANAASLFLSPSSGSFVSGQVFSIGVFIASPDQAMNAVSGNITVSQDKLEILGISRNVSIVNFWAKEPSVSAGSVDFEGVVLNPGYQGNSGALLTVTLKAVDAGEAIVRFSSGTVLANDGEGTKIPAVLGKAVFILTEAQTKNVTAKTTLPTVTSKTHPDSDRWYANNEPVFSWSLPKDVTGVSFGVNPKPDASPDTQAEELVSKMEFTEVSDGVNYFHIRFQNKDGWSDAVHYKFQTDTTLPSKPSVIFPHGDGDFCPRPEVTMFAKDKPSGIDFYKVIIDDDDTVNVEAENPKEESSVFLPSLRPGKHIITVFAVDKAGNKVFSDKDFEILDPDKAGDGEIPAGFICPNYIPVVMSLIGIIFILLIAVFYLVYRLLDVKKKSPRKKKRK